MAKNRDFEESLCGKLEQNGGSKGPGESGNQQQNQSEGE